TLSGTLTARLLDGEGREVASVAAPVADEIVELALDGLEGIALWDVGNPVLYTLSLTLETPHGVDEGAARFGFRTAEFLAQGFFLNGRHLKLRGLNRHQSFPYAGYAMGR